MTPLDTYDLMSRLKGAEPWGMGVKWLVRIASSL